MKPDLDAVPETLLLSLWGRAEATRRGSPILSDRQAVEIVDRLDYDFSRIRGAVSAMSYAQWVAVSRQFDSILGPYIREYPCCTVVNLGAGLDTSFGRLDNGSVRWFDLDLPEVVALRRKVIPETDRNQCLEGSVMDPAWMQAVPQTDQGVFFLASSVLFYFEEADVKNLFGMLHDRFPGAHLAFNTVTRPALDYANKMVRRAGMRNAVLKWSLDDPDSLSSWGRGLNLVEWRSIFKGIPRTGLNLQSRFLMWLVDRKKMNAIVHCQL